MSALRADTRPSHARLESRLGVERSVSSRLTYLALMSAQFGFHVPLEQRLAQVPWPAALQTALELERRRKSPLLERDLGILGLSAQEVHALPICAVLPQVETIDDALGCLYVIEGATLGGQLLLRAAKRELGIGPQDGAAFLSSYGRDVGRMWTRFRDVLAEACSDADAAAAKAVETFDCFEHWMVLRGCATGAVGDDLPVDRSAPPTTEPLREILN